MRQNKTLTIVVAVVVILLLISAIFFESAYVSMLTTVVALVGGLAIYYQIYKESKIAEGQFIHELDNSFKSDDIWEIANRLFTVEDALDDEGHFVVKKPLEDGDQAKIMAYLTFFETLYLLIEQNVISMAEVDQLFRRRFFKATMNREIQELELVKHYYGYTNIYLLDAQWRRYLEKLSRRGTNQLATIVKHGVSLEDAHNAFWSRPENLEYWADFEKKCDEELCNTYEKVVRLGGGRLPRKRRG